MTTGESTETTGIDYDITFQNIKKGEVVKGHVLQVRPKDVIVDIGYKSEGIIPIEEFSEAQRLQTGDEVDVYVEHNNQNSSNGSVHYAKWLLPGLLPQHQ